jgi:succinate dehydrogenase / fumarate reductase, membrane anchor subunit
MTGAGQPRPESGLELYAWIFMRISGIALLVLALGHLLVMHIINSVDTEDFQFVANRYATPFWRTFDLMLLWLAMIHGINGLRTVLVDYVNPRGWRLTSLASLYLAGFVLLALGSIAILTFQPPPLVH